MPDVVLSWEEEESKREKSVQEREAYQAAEIGFLFMSTFSSFIAVTIVNIIMFVIWLSGAPNWITHNLWFKVIIINGPLCFNKSSLYNGIGELWIFFFLKKLENKTGSQG